MIDKTHKLTDNAIWRVKQSIIGLDRSWVLQEAEDPRFQDNRHINL
jgi:hypothetical protein